LPSGFSGPFIRHALAPQTLDDAPQLFDGVDHGRQISSLFAAGSTRTELYVAGPQTSLPELESAMAAHTIT